MYGKRNLFSVEELAFVDSFHIRGRTATISLAKEAGIREGMNILDIGSGPGGTARYLSSAFGAEVVGLDLTYDFTRLAGILSTKVSLPARNDFVCGDAEGLPFGEKCFDRVWMEHVQMNITGKKNLVEEIFRVLKPGGALAVYEVFQTGEAPPDYPLPWAEKPEGGVLISPEKMKEILETTGFDISRWHDCHNDIADWHTKVNLKSGTGGEHPPGVHLLMGKRAEEKVYNFITGVLDKRLAVIEAVLRK